MPAQTLTHQNKTPTASVCVLHDTFLYRGGGERLVLFLTKALKADLASGFFDAGSYPVHEWNLPGKIISLTSSVFKKGLRHFKLRYVFAYKTKFLREYKTVVFSGDCLAAVGSLAPDAKSIYYCHTPPRYLFDQYDRYYHKVPWYLRPTFVVAVWYFRFSYQRAIRRFSLVLTNSVNTQKRIQQYIGIHADILYPPVDTDFFVPGSLKGDYFLSFARLADIKRVDRIVDAFLQMPHKRLILTYGANDPQRAYILAKVRTAPNIIAVKAPSDTQLRSLIQSAIATIYIPQDEDFGMSPLESMACGVPVIGVNE